MNPEQQPEHNPINIFRLEFNTGQEIVCHRNNTSAFLHSEEPYGDHLFVHTPAIDDEPERGDYVFREQISNFDYLVGRMAVSDWVIIQSDKLTEDDREAYEEFQALKSKNVEQAEKKASELTPRKERLVSFLGYLLLHDHLTADDFNKGTGPLYL